MTTQHTPGPWGAVDCAHDYSIQEIHDVNGDIVAVAVREEHNEDSTETTQNARLIAAAPEMLSALKLAIHALNRARRFQVPSVEMDSYEIATIVDAAIKKATNP
jgi:hypothetical protein